LKEHTDPDIVIYLVGNKLDIVHINPKFRDVSTGEAKQFAKNNNYFFKEVSAITGEGVNDVFDQLLEGIYR